MKSLSRNLLVGAMLAALPLSGAMACTVSQWNGAKTSVDADAKSPPASARYSGVCALDSTTSGNYVGDNHPVNDPAYNARFYVYTGLTSGNAKVFGAYSADDGGGSELISVTYDRAAGSFAFAANGASATTTGIVANKWYAIEFAYAAGSSFSAEVAGANGFSNTPAVTGAPAAGNIESARLGFISGSGAGAIKTDEFESTRGVAIGRLCPGNAAGAEPGTFGEAGTINIFDRVAVVNELLGNSLATGQPDCTEDGTVNIFDRVCVVNTILAGGACQ